MKSSAKGALLSGLVFPGLGQIALKRYKRGIGILLVVTGSMAAIIWVSVKSALSILQEADLAGHTISSDAISDAAAQATRFSGSSLLMLILLLVLICWIYATIDAYITGRRIDSEAGSLQKAAQPTDGE